MAPGGDEAWYRQLEGQKAELRKHRDLRERSQVRIAARRLAVEQHSRAAREREAALIETKQRSELAGRLAEARDAIGPAKQKVDSLNHVGQATVTTQARLKSDLIERRERRRAIKLHSAGRGARLHPSSQEVLAQYRTQSVERVP